MINHSCGQEASTNAKLEDKLSKVLTTDKQKQFLRNRLAGLNKRQAAIQAGYAPSTASIMAKRLTDRLSCNKYFIEEAHRQGLTVEAIIGEIKRGMSEAMHATHPDQPDNFNRRAYTDMAVKVYGGYAPTKYDVRQESLSKHMVVDYDTIRRAAKNSGEALLDENGNIIMKGNEEAEVPNREDEDI